MTKNQDRRVELLAESLEKQDQMIERLDKHEILLNRIAEVVENQNERIGRIESNVAPLVKSVNNLSDIVIHALDHGKEIQEIKDVVSKL